jgi:hypothetical protein
VNKDAFYFLENTKMNLNNNNKKMNEFTKDFQHWSKKIEQFFIAKFFPTAENYRSIRQIMNRVV